jgi:hypothetical protein
VPANSFFEGVKVAQKHTKRTKKGPVNSVVSAKTKPTETTEYKWFETQKKTNFDITFTLRKTPSDE